jgi:hypothetical protein
MSGSAARSEGGGQMGNARISNCKLRGRVKLPHSDETKTRILSGNHWC